MIYCFRSLKFFSFLFFFFFFFFFFFLFYLFAICKDQSVYKANMFFLEVISSVVTGKRIVEMWYVKSGGRLAT